MRNLHLDSYDPRYDPTVVPIRQSDTNVPALINVLNSSYRPNLTGTKRHYTIKDYHSAYEAGKTTPIAVAEALLNLISKHPEHKDAFLEIQKDRVIASAQASTQRYKAGKALGIFDGVPVGVKGKSFFSCIDSCQCFLRFWLRISVLLNSHLFASVSYLGSIKVDWEFQMRSISKATQGV